VNAVLGQVVSEHPLHSFSPRYFGAGSDERLFSYSASACEGARALLHSQAAPPSGRSFVPHPLPSSPASAFEAGDLAVQPSEPGRPEPEELEIADLGRFFEHPVRFFLQRQLGLYLASEAPALEDREPTELDALDEWQVADALMRFELSGVDAERARQLVRATGVLPPGQPGELVAEKLARRVESFARRVRELQRGEALESLRVDRVLGRGGPRAVRLTGVICDLWPHARVVHRLSRVPHPHELNFWLQHLVLCWLQAPGVPMQSCFVARPERGEGVVVVKLPPVADAASTLEDLVDLYRIGQRAPLPLFPRTSRIHADESLREGWAEVSAKAERAWRGGGGIGPGPENVDPYLLQVFREIDPLAADSELAGGLEFAELARRVYEPFLTLREELREELPGEPQ
jgi:exodeoxyribonuclease V gamma subunit